MILGNESDIHKYSIAMYHCTMYQKQQYLETVVHCTIDNGYVEYSISIFHCTFYQKQPEDGNYLIQGTCLMGMYQYFSKFQSNSSLTDLPISFNLVNQLLVLFTQCYQSYQFFISCFSIEDQYCKWKWRSNRDYNDYVMGGHWIINDEKKKKSVSAMPATLKPGSTFNLNIEMIPQSCLKCQFFLSLTTYSKLAEKKWLGLGTHPILEHTSNLSRIPRIYPCKFFWAGVNFYRFNAKNWHFRQILREKVAFFFTDLKRKIGVF